MTLFISFLTPIFTVLSPIWCCISFSSYRLWSFTPKIMLLVNSLTITSKELSLPSTSPFSQYLWGCLFHIDVILPSVARWPDELIKKVPVSIYKWISGKLVNAEISFVQERWSNTIVFLGTVKLQECNSGLPRGNIKILWLASSLFMPVQEFEKGKWVRMFVVPWAWQEKNNRTNICVCK